MNGSLSPTSRENKPNRSKLSFTPHLLLQFRFKITLYQRVGGELKQVISSPLERLPEYLDTLKRVPLLRAKMIRCRKMRKQSAEGFALLPPQPRNGCSYCWHSVTCCPFQKSAWYFLFSPGSLGVSPLLYTAASGIPSSGWSGSWVR